MSSPRPLNDELGRCPLTTAARSTGLRNGELLALRWQDGEMLEG